MSSVAAMGDLKPNFSAAKKSSIRPSYNTRHISTEWPISDVSSDLIVEVGSSSFALHKFPLVSRSGRIRHEVKDTKTSRINLSSIPGGVEAFEVAAKFCYGINIDINLTNVAMLRCASHYLEMTEDYAPPREKNLESITESYLKDNVFPSITNSISVLHDCENLLPAAEEIKLIARIVTSIANNACKEQLSSRLQKLEQNYHPSNKGFSNLEAAEDWWGRSLASLSLDLFHRVLSALKLKGLKHEVISRILIHYAHNSLQGQVMIRDHQHSQLLMKVGGGVATTNGGYNTDLELIKKQRVIVETMVSLLPTPSRKTTSVPIAFLSSLLKSGIEASVSTSCRTDLERRIGLQLDQAILEDIIIPAPAVRGNNYNHGGGGTLYDIDTVLRIFSIFLNLDEDDDDNDDDDDDGGDDMNRLRDVENEMMYDFDHGTTVGSPKQSSLLKVSKLLDSYLAEVALDSGLNPSKFIALAELLPDHARIITDSLYRAVDIYLKVHPNIKDSERYRLCKTIDCQKLSQEASSHAAQNERLPVQIAVQVLYYEQIRLRNAMINGGGGGVLHHHQQQQHSYLFSNSLNNGSQLIHPQHISSCAGSGAITPRDNYASVRRENRELKLEVTRMRMRLTDLEKDHVHMKQELVTSSSNPANKLFRSFSKKLSRLSSVFRVHNIHKPNSLSSKVDSQPRFFFQKRRHHSIS